MDLLPLLKKIESPDDAHRRRAIINEISSLGLTPIIDGYKVEDFRGDNIMVTLPGQIRKKIVLIAHTDTFKGSPGANDDASGCTILLDILRRLKGQKLKYAVKFIFFDQKEKGMVGSRAYLRKFEIDNVIAVLNPKMVGLGDSFVTWAVDRKTKKGVALSAMRRACKSLGVHLEELKYLEELSGDYVSFKEEGNNNSLAFATSPLQELKLLKQYVRHPLWSYGKYKLGLLRFPKLFKHYHNSLDRSIFLSEASLQMSAEMLYRTVSYLGKI